MRKEAMIPGTDGEDAQPVKRDADGNRLPSDARPDSGKADEVYQDKWNSRWINDVVIVVGDFWHESDSPAPYGDYLCSAS